MAKRKQPNVDEADGVKVGEEPVPGMRLRCICRGHTGIIGRIAWSPCGRFIASPSFDKTIRIWDATKGICLAVLEGHKSRVINVAWSSDGEIIASGDDSGKIILWHAGSRSAFDSLHGDSHNDQGLVWCPDGTVLAGRFNGRFGFWNRTTNKIKHLDGADNVAWTVDGKTLAIRFSDAVDIRDEGRKKEYKTLSGVPYSNAHLSWSPNKTTLAVVSGHSAIEIWNGKSGVKQITLEGHTDRVTAVSFSSDGLLLASKGNDAAIRLWDTNGWERIAEITESPTDKYAPSIQFHPKSSCLATLGAQDTVVRVWDLSTDLLLSIERDQRSVRYASAKIVLVGESNVGKSCLAMRLAEDRYPDDHEHGTTHGMRFWLMEAEELHPSAKPPEGQRRDVVLWDFGGQDEYQLVHQMFLHDTTLALVLIDPTRGRAALDEARDWNKRLEKHLSGRQAVKLLVGAKQDRASRLVNRAAIDELCHECGFDGYSENSAKTGRNVKSFRKGIADALDWDNLAKTSRPELFQRIWDDIEKRRKAGEIVVLLGDLKAALKKAHPENYEEAAVGAVSDQLATQGVIAQTKLTSGEEALVLQLPVLERYAGSLIVAARNNPRGVPALEERLLGSPKLPLPGMNKKDRVERFQEKIVLECIAELMIQHGICFRHEGLLVFPTLFPQTTTVSGEKLPHSVSLFYDFTGAIDNIYASLVARLMISKKFGEGRLWPGRVEFDQPSQGVCGIRQIKRTGGLAHVDLFFAEDTNEKCRNLFTRFVEEHLRQHGVEIREHQAIKCRECEFEISEEIVQENIAREQKDVVCPKCRTLTLISEGVARIRERDPLSDQRIYALRKEVEKRTRNHVRKAKKAVAAAIDTKVKAKEPIRLLHLSDLHFTKDTSPRTRLQLLLQDIRKGECLQFDTVEYVVISGDMTDRGDEEGLERAREFVSLLNEKLGVSAQRCIFVPGNHDVQDMEEAYHWYSAETRARQAEPDENLWHREGGVIFVPNKNLYPNRLRQFSDAFFHKIIQKPYPLEFAQQGIGYLFPETGIQFLTLNSCWQIDQFHRKRSGVHRDAVEHVLDQADRQVEDATKRGDIKKGQEVLRIGVWHHSLQHPEMMRDTAFVGVLQNAGVRLCLHGDVHEMNRDLFRYWHPKKMHVVGAGSFGSPAKGRPESVPRLYNLLEIEHDFGVVRVHTRRQCKPDGPWDGWYEWPDPDDRRKHVPYYDIDLR